jgi:hypothetical protein
MTKKTDLWLEESPIDVVAGEKVTYSVTWTGKTAGSGPETHIYKNNKLMDKTMLAHNEDTSIVNAISNGSPPVQTLPTISFGEKDGGSEFVLIIQATVDGQTELHKCLFRCVKKGATQ